MRFLVTRPQPECRHTADRLRAAGHEADEAPLLALSPCPPDDFNLEGVAALAFTARRSVAILADHAQFGNLLPLPVFTVGDATAGACRRAGFEHVRSAGADVAGLAALVLAHAAEILPGKVLYPAARERAGDLERLLAAGGVRCDTVTVYGMEPVDVLADSVTDRLRSGSYDGVLVYSRRTAATLGALATHAGLSEALSSVPVFALSERTAAALEGHPQVRVAPAPTEDALLDLALTRC